MSFGLFTAYQVRLAISIEESRIGRLIGIGVFVLITVASILALFDNPKCRKAHARLLIIGLMLLFVVKLINLPSMFSNLDFKKIPSVLNCAVLVGSELGTLVLAVGYLVLLRADLTERELRRWETALMSVVIVLFAACFVTECLLLLKYHTNIDQSLNLTICSRVVYCVGFAGTAFCFLLPEPQTEHKARLGDYIYSDDDEDEIDLVI